MTLLKDNHLYFLHSDVYLLASKIFACYLQFNAVNKQFLMISDKKNYATDVFCFQAYVLLGRFLLLRKNEELFKDWLKEEVGANKKQGKNAYYCLKQWCDAFL